LAIGKLGSEGGLHDIGVTPLAKSTRFMLQVQRPVVGQPGKTRSVMSNEYDAANPTSVRPNLPWPHSDRVLGIFLLVVAALAALLIGGSPISPLANINPWFFPACVMALLMMTGAALVGRGFVSKPGSAPPWRTTELAVIAALLMAAYLVATYLTAGGWVSEFAFKFGPAEYVATLVLLLTIVIVIAHASRMRALAIALLGILLALVGTDVNSGLLRYTFDVAQLTDGIGPGFVMLGLVVVADGLLCLVSPPLFLNSYTRLMALTFFERIAGPLSLPVGLLLRVVAICAIGAACSWVYSLNDEVWDVGLVLAFGVFGIACKLFGWNRYILYAAFNAGPHIEEHFRRALILAKGDPTVFLQRPISAALLALVCLLLLARPVRWMVSGRAGKL
jgi:Tripartite tricarboxylate transporter TctA family